MIDIRYLQSEYIKCYRDKSRIYMIQNYLKTYDATQGREVKYTLFPKQQDLCNTFASGHNVVCTKPRQAGITTTASAFIACEMCLADSEQPQTVLCIGNTLDLAQQFLFKVRDFLLQFPLWMWGDDFFDKGYDILKAPENRNIIFDVCNNKELRLKNGCKVVARSSGPDASRGVGGVTWLVLDEAAFIENGKDVYASAVPTISTGGHTIMISTPNGKDQLYYETCRRAALKGTSDWNNFELAELKWYQDPRYNKFLEWTRKNKDTGEVDIYKEPLLDKTGTVKWDDKHWTEMVNDGWKPRSPWYVKMCQQFNNDSQKIAQELDVSFLGSASNVVDPEFIEMQRQMNYREPLPKSDDGDMFHLEDTWIWKKPVAGHRYICAVDCSRGDSDDRSAVEMIDLDGEDNGIPCVEQVMEYNGKITGDDLGEIVYWYASYYNTAFVVVEAIGGYGDATILSLMRLGYTNLYYDDPTLKTFTAQRDASSIKMTSDGKLPGFHSSSVRFQMLALFANDISTNAYKVRSKRVLAELDTWIFKNGRQDHQDGCHDDTITCTAMGMFVYKYHFSALQAAKEKDASFLNAWINSAKKTAIRVQQGKQTTHKTYTSEPTKTYAPFYTTSTLSGGGNGQSYMWLLK